MTIAIPAKAATLGATRLWAFGLLMLAAILMAAQPARAQLRVDI